MAERCKTCYLIDQCAWGIQAIDQTRVLDEEQLARFLDRVAGIDGCERPDLRDEGIIQAAEIKRIRPPESVRRRF